MDTQTVRIVRSLYRGNPQFCRTPSSDPTALLVRMQMEDAETARILAGPLHSLLDRSPEQILAYVLEGDPPVWEGMPPEPIPPA